MATSRKRNSNRVKGKSAAKSGEELGGKVGVQGTSPDSPEGGEPEEDEPDDMCGMERGKDNCNIAPAISQDGEESSDDEDEKESHVLRGIATHCGGELPKYLKTRILHLEEVEKKLSHIRDKYSDAVEENVALKRKIEELGTAKRMLEMSKKKKKRAQLSPEQRQLLSEASQTISNVVCRQVKFPPKGWQGWSEEKNSVCMMILPNLSFPPGATLSMKRDTWMDVIAPALGRMMTQSRNRITQPMKKTFMCKCAEMANASYYETNIVDSMICEQIYMGRRRRLARLSLKMP